jgi:hypothetical protein
MSNKDRILQQLIAMSRALGEPENDYVIIGEGNTSAQLTMRPSGQGKTMAFPVAGRK